MKKQSLPRNLLLFPIVFFLGACHALDARQSAGGTPEDAAGVAVPANATPALDLRRQQSLSQIVSLLADKRVVYVGESHSKYHHHLNQLQVIRQLYRQNPNLAIGMEFFQQPFQPALDDYIAGRITEQEMLRRTQWYDRWIYDYRLYRPLLRFARENRIPLIALNVPKELTDRVSKVGIEGLTIEERKRLPARIDTSDEAYRKRLQGIFRQHENSEKRSFDRFMEVQLTWDEGMASRAAEYLRANPERQLVLLAGSGHLMFGSGIPQRLQRRVAAPGAILLPGDDLRIRPGVADFVVYPEPEQLPAAGLMGILLGEGGSDGVTIDGVVPGSAAAGAGLQKGDIIRQLDERPMKTAADIKIALLDRKPGDRVQLHVLRKRLVWGDKELEFDFPLGGG